MPKYLYTSDLRISELAERIRGAAKKFASGLSITDKSESNNSATLQFYFNLEQGTQTLEDAQHSPENVIRNYILKFQFPNPRTAESLLDSIAEHTFLAPYRMVVSVLTEIAKIENTLVPRISLNEILYYIFCNKKVYTNPEINLRSLAKTILDSRKESIDLQPLIKNTIEWNQYGRQSREMFTVLEKGCRCFSIRNGVLAMNLVNISQEDKDFTQAILKNNSFWFPSDINNLQLAQKEYISYMDTKPTPYNIINFNKSEEVDAVVSESLQQIFYGAPGTGKSHTVKQETEKWEKEERVIRTTFHPDSDYSTFVGAYKPTMDFMPVRNAQGLLLKTDGSMTAVDNGGTNLVREKQITYSFVPQAFLQAYVEAWADREKPEYLVIEEINRGNCAQIFGDLFQLLDRGGNGYSEYPIKADRDLQTYLEEEFKRRGVEIADFPNVQSGKELLLPRNLFIRATMNTSDQSLFPIDSAFKRRWDWQYVPIHNVATEGYQVEVDGERYDWWSFLKEINARILKTTSSEDKQLGYFFCKAKKVDDKNIISAETFVSKVVSYIWNDIFKDYEFSDDAFNEFTDDKGKVHKLEFKDFYDADINGKTIVVTDKIRKFFSNLKLTASTTSTADDEEYEGQAESEEKADTDRNDWSEIEKKRYDFWTEFLEYAHQNEEFEKYFAGVKKPSTEYWKNFFIKGQDFYLVLVQQRRKNAFEIQVYFNETNDTYYRLFDHKADIEREMGTSYEWRELPGKKSSIISENKTNVDYDNKNSFRDIYDFAIDRLLRMRKVFTKYAQK